jgi:hypothetical protein
MHTGRTPSEDEVEEMGMMQLQARNSKECQQPPKAKRGMGQILPGSPQKEPTLMPPPSQTPELGGTHAGCLTTTQFVVLCSDSLRKLIQPTFHSQEQSQD